VLNAPPEDQASLDSRFASHVNGKLSKHNWALEFLLLFVPNVEELIVLNTNQWNIDIYWFTNIAANPERFQGLQSISINGPVRMENIIPLLTMPALKDLKLEQVFAMRLRVNITYPWGATRPYDSRRCILWTRKTGHRKPMRFHCVACHRSQCVQGPQKLCV
jgi:hypothetical protein